MTCSGIVYAFEKLSSEKHDTGHGPKSGMSGTLNGEFTAQETAAVLSVVAARGTATSREDIRGALRAADLRPERQNPRSRSVV